MYFIYWIEFLEISTCYFYATDPTFIKNKSLGPSHNESWTTHVMGHKPFGGVFVPNSSRFTIMLSGTQKKRYYNQSTISYIILIVSCVSLPHYLCVIQKLLVSTMDTSSAMLNAVITIIVFSTTICLAFLLFCIINIWYQKKASTGQLPSTSSTINDSLGKTNDEEISLPEENSIEGYRHDFDCAICCSEAKEDVPSLPCMWRVLPECQHRFHSDCIWIWLAVNNTCPLCRKAVSQVHD